MVGALELHRRAVHRLPSLADHDLPPEARRQHAPRRGRACRCPPFTLAQGNKIPADFPLPAIVKPAAEDASVGIDRARCAPRARALARAGGHDAASSSTRCWSRSTWPGREFNVGFVGDRMLPIAEIDFDRMPEGSWPIVTYAAKWTPGSAEDLGTAPVCPAQAPTELLRRIERGGTAGLDASWRTARGTAGWTCGSTTRAQPWVLEVNPCPDLSSDAGLARMGRAVGWDYDELVLQVVEEALMRAQSRSAAGALSAQVSAA